MRCERRATELASLWRERSNVFMERAVIPGHLVRMVPMAVRSRKSHRLLSPRYLSDVAPSATAVTVSSGGANDSRLLIWLIRFRDHLRRYCHPRPTTAAAPSRICSRALPVTGSR